eukprot:Nk52_evm1s1977 gene=Nk52_evmTU1s1977
MKARHTMKRAYDKFHGVKEPSSIQIGEVVYVRRPTRGRKKYTSLFDGPYLISQVDEVHKSVKLMDPLNDVELPSDIGFERLKRLELSVEDLVDFTSERSKEYEVAAILDHKNKD